MPEIAASMESAVLSTWLVAEGEAFSAKDVIAVIETDKAVVDFEAEAGGTLIRRLVQDGTDVAVGAAIALIATPGEAIDDVDAVLAQMGEAFTSAAAPSGAAADSQPTRSGQVSDARERRFSSPLARKLAREAGLDIARITGSGPGGRIVRRDVTAATGTSASPPPIAAAPPAPIALPATGRGTVDIPHTRLRRAVAARLIESKTTAPHFYVRGTARVDELLRLREQINDGADARVSVNDLFIKAMAKAHQAVPSLNVQWSPDAIRQFDCVDISVAIATDRGLVTPVLRGVERMTVSEVASSVRDFAERARAGRIQQHELEGGSTSISNLGMFGTEEFAAIINPPQASILAVGATRSVAIVVDGTVVPGTVVTVTLSVDHRPVDGVEAARWMRAFITVLERPAQILA
jgi:pyruvate dehydrogenase E2 component (dihydrolipoamide acetyltransferase)